MFLTSKEDVCISIVGFFSEWMLEILEINGFVENESAVI